MFAVPLGVCAWPGDIGRLSPIEGYATDPRRRMGNRPDGESNGGSGIYC